MQQIPTILFGQNDILTDMGFVRACCTVDMSFCFIKIIKIKRKGFPDNKRFYCYNWSVKKTLGKGGYQIVKP
ncbi:MAG: hypothetical protein P1P85_05510 [Patescibacteria group bacterium]|nr:hypothetical protein [Patescibacteria group bacterium]